MPDYPVVYCPGDRRIGFVFQRYALLARMTAVENITCGLRVLLRRRRLREPEFVNASTGLLAMVQLSGFGARVPLQRAASDSASPWRALAIAVVADANECVVATDNERDFAGPEFINPLRGGQ